MKLTAYQEKIGSVMRAMVAGEEKASILIIDAKAGCAKTTTLVKVVLPAIPAGKAVFCGTFGSRINEEMVAKVAKERSILCGPTTSTFHSAGNKLVAKNWGYQRLNNWREQNLAEKIGWNKDTHYATIRCAASIAQKFKEIAPFGNREDLENISERFGFFVPAVEKEGTSFGEVIDLAEQILARSKRKDGTISYADMIWLPLVLGWVKRTYDVVIVDECQDLNLVQIEFAQAILKVGGILVVVGDPRQAIFEFRGADSKSISRIEEEFAHLGVIKCLLPETFRCGKAIVREAQRFVPEFVAHETNHEGKVTSADYDKMFGEVKAGDAILSRKNAPLASACLRLWRAGVKAHIEGRKFGDSIVTLCDNLTGKRPMDLVRFFPLLDTYARREEEKMAGKRNEESLREELWEKVECLEVLSDGLATVEELKARIKSLFADTEKVGRAGRVILSSIHRAKGLEWERVFGLEWTLMSHSEEEENLAYVLITRAKNELIWVSKAA